MGTDDTRSRSRSRNENDVETETETESQKRKFSSANANQHSQDEDEDEEDEDDEDSEEELRPPGQGVTPRKLCDPSRWGCRCPETKLQKMCFVIGNLELVTNHTTITILWAGHRNLRFLGLLLLIVYMIWSWRGWDSGGILPVPLRRGDDGEGTTSKKRKQQDIPTKVQRGLRDVQTFLAYPLLVLNTWAGINILLGVFTRTVVFCSMHLVAGVFVVIVLIPYATCGALRTENYVIFLILFLLVILYSFFGASSWALIQEISVNKTRKVGAAEGSSFARP